MILDLQIRCTNELIMSVHIAALAKLVEATVLKTEIWGFESPTPVSFI